MNIKIRLSVQFTLIVTVILLFFSVLVYYFSYTSQLNKFRESLLERAENTAILLLNVSEVDSTLLKKIHLSTISLPEEEIALTDSADNLVYNNNIQYLSDDVLQLYSDENDLNYFSLLEKDGVCFKHHYNNHIYNVFVLASDTSRTESLKGLRKILFWSILFSVWLSVLLSYFFSQKAIKPISQIIKSVKAINSLRLSNRLDEGNRKDEIAQLAITFNEMLTNLEIAFKSQEDFVSNASHELRTPLTVMMVESDYIISRGRKEEDYVNHISGIISDLKKINSLLNNLLELAQVNRDKTISFTKVRIDEVVFNAIYQIKTKYQGRKIVPKILYPECENDLFIYGNDGLLTISFQNLLDNACKFSNDDINIEFLITDNYINILIEDSGIGIPSDELESINRPFKRASNAKYIGGFGIGLSLVVKIMELHKATIDIKSKVNEGTRIDILFRRYQSIGEKTV